MKKILIIEADTNDGDYIEESHEIQEEELVEFKNILSKLPRNKDYQGNVSGTIPFKTGDIGNTGKKLVEKGIITEEELYLFYDYIPHGEHGIHTIESVRVLTVLEDIDLLEK